MDDRIDMIYDKRLNSFSRKYLVKGNERLVKNPLLFDKELDEILSEIGELLLYHDGIAFHVYGENIPLAILINVFGVKGIEELMEQGAVKFVFNVPEVGYNVDEIPGIIPLVSMSGFTSKAHSDPEESAALGLNWLLHPLHEKQKRRIIKKSLNAYQVPRAAISADAAKFGVDGYNNDLFKSLGLPKQKDITKLNLNERKLLCQLAGECVTMSILSELNYNTHESFRTARVYRAEYANLYNASAIEKMTDKLFRLEKLPNFKAMLRSGRLRLGDIPEMRSRRDSIRFRKWIASCAADNDGQEITKEYLNAIDNTKGLFDVEPYKFLKTLTVYALGAAVGSLAAGPMGTVLGGTAGALLNPLTDIGLNLFDTYVLSGIAKGWNPRHYFTKQIEPLSGDFSSRSGRNPHRQG